MKRSSLIPIASSRNFSKVERPLKSDGLPNYIRNANFDPNSEFESVFVPTSTLTVYPTVVDVDTCLPVYLDRLLPPTDYSRDGLKIVFDPKYAGTLIYLYRPKISYGSGYERNDNLYYRTDTTSALYLKVGSTIQDVVTEFKPFRITIPYEASPEKIAHKVYGGEYTLWWYIMQYNGFIYPEHCELNSIIRIPDYHQLKSWIKSIQPSSSNAMQYKGKRVRL
jgi:hypothetical protein